MPGGCRVETGGWYDHHLQSPAGRVGLRSIQAGDEVKVSVAEELAVYLGRNSLPASAGTDTVKLHVRLPDGTQAAAAEVATLVYTGKITAINDWNDTVTLQLPGG